MKAETSEAKKFSPVPTPTTNGEFRRAPTMVSGESLWIASSVNEPRNCVQTDRIAVAKLFVRLNSSLSRCATDSVSVSEENVYPRRSNSERSST